MMKKLYPVILALLASLGVYAQAPAPYPILVDSQRDTVAALQVFQANAITFRASFKSGGTANSIVAETPFMYWQPFGATNATVVTAQWSIVSAPSGIVDFAFTPASLNYAAGTYTYQIGLDQSGGPLVIKQGVFKINPSAASIGAEPIVFSTTNINWGSINWSGVPDWDLITNVNAKLTTLSNNLQSAVDAINDGSTWSQFPATQTVDMAQQYVTNLGGVHLDLTPSGSIAPGLMQWNPDMETVRLGLDAAVSLDVGQQQVAFVRNAESVTISNGTVVYISGATGDKATVKIASYSNDTLSARTIGIAAEDIVSGGTGFVVTRGPVYAQKTDTFTEGAMLYLGAYGNVTTNRPQAPLHGVFVGVVEKVNANAGVIYVAVQNGFEMDELHDVNVSGVTSGQILKYNGTVWTNAAETDPVWAAASNSIDTRITANTTGKVALTTYTPATQALWAAIGGIVSAENALTNVTGDSRITATKTGNQVALTFNASGLATGTPIYSVAGLATGTPVYTESDPIWTSASSLYYTISAADAKFATGSPIYSVAGLATGTPLYTFTELDPTAITNVTASGRLTATKTGKQVALTFDGTGLATGTPVYSLSGYLTSTGAAATYLPLAGGTMATEAVINMSEGTISNVNFVGYFGGGGYIQFEELRLYGQDWSFEQQPIIPGYLTSTGAAATYMTYNGGDLTGQLRVAIGGSGATSMIITNSGNVATGLRADLGGGATYLDFNQTGGGAGDEYTFSDTIANFHGNKITNAVVDGYLTSTGAVATYLGITSFNASSNAINTRLVAVEGYTNRAASALSSSVWASADSTTNYIKRNGTTATEGISLSASSTASVNLTLTNNGLAATGLRVNMDANSTFADFNIGGTNNEYTITDTAFNLHGNIITNAGNIFGNAAGLTNLTLTGYVNTNNLSTIAGSGLGVTGNQLVVTNVAGTFEGLTGNRFSLGNSSVTNISVTATGAFVAVRLGSSGTNSIGDRSYGASQQGYIVGTATIGDLAYGASQQGYVQGTAIIGLGAAGARQEGIVTGTAFIDEGAYGAVQRGRFFGSATIGRVAIGASQFGYLTGGTATNEGHGAIQLIGGDASNEVYTTTGAADGSLLLGPGTQTNAYGILANGPIQTLSGFQGNASGLTNFPSSILTVSAGNTNYWRITTAPTGATAFGTSGQLAVSGTNIYIYSPNALGVGTARWLRVTGDAAW